MANKPFFCGTQYLDWQNHNCCQCAKISDEQWERDAGPEWGLCEIFDAISEGMHASEVFTEEMLARMGYEERDLPLYVWDCAGKYTRSFRHET